MSSIYQCMSIDNIQNKEYNAHSALSMTALLTNSKHKRSFKRLKRLQRLMSLHLLLLNHQLLLSRNNRKSYLFNQSSTKRKLNTVMMSQLLLALFALNTLTQTPLGLKILTLSLRKLTLLTLQSDSCPARRCLNFSKRKFWQEEALDSWLETEIYGLTLSTGLRLETLATILKTTQSARDLAQSMKSPLPNPTPRLPKVSRV